MARRDGLAGISLRDLADSVDLRQPSLYAYFESKLGLYDLMFEDGQRQLLDRCVAREPLADAREELVAIVEDLVRFSGEDDPSIPTWIVRHLLVGQPGHDRREEIDVALRLRACGAWRSVMSPTKCLAGSIAASDGSKPGMVRWKSS